MALDNSFYIRVSHDPNQIRSWIVENLDYQKSEEPNTLLKKGVVAIVDRYKPHFNIVEETYGFTPNISIYFRLDKFDAFDDGYENMLHLIICILKNFNSEAILLGPGGETSLLYKENQLVLQKDEWTGDDLSLFDLPYTVREIVNM